MIQIAYFMLIVWLPVSVILLIAMPPVQAVTLSVVFSTLILPPFAIQISGFPDYTKLAASTYGVLLGTFLFQPARLLAFRPKWYDLPVLLFPISTCYSVATNVTAYDGLSFMLRNLVTWTLPYLIGRLYFSSGDSLRILAKGLAIGTFLMVPLALFEMRMGTQLLPRLYGIGWFEGERMGGVRPRVFLSTGLEFGLWICLFTMNTWWIARTGSLKRIWEFPSRTVVVPVLFVTSVLCRSTGALALLAMGAIALWFSSRRKNKLLLWILVLTPVTYYTFRIPNIWQGTELVNFVNNYIDTDRAESLEFRFKNEVILEEKALQRPFFGWGGFGRARVYDEKSDRDIAITDGLWIIMQGDYGLVGLACLTLGILLPSARLLWKVRAKDLNHPDLAPAVVLVLVISLFWIDCLLNAFPNMVYFVIAGGLNGFVSRIDRAQFDSVRAETVPRILPGMSGQKPHPLQISRESSTPTLEEADRRKIKDYRDLARHLRANHRLTDAKNAWVQAALLSSQAARKNPDSTTCRADWTDCLNDLAWFLISESDMSIYNPIESLALAKQATDADPSNLAYWNTLGAALYRVGQYRESVIALERSLHPDRGGTGFDYFLLSMACNRLGERENAEAWFAKATVWMEHNPNKHAELTRLHDEASALLSGDNESIFPVG